MLQIRLLGEVRAVTDRGEAVDVGPAKCQALLAALALSAGTAVPMWHLVESVWGAEPPRTADRTLQSYVTRLRKGLGPDAIVRVGTSYRLDVSADSVDVLRFQRHSDRGDVEAALAEWTGFPLSGLDVPGLAATVDGLVERWLALVEADLGTRLEIDPSAVIGPLTELTAKYPFREGLWASLMTALYRVGRQRDALTAYGTARQTLIEHLGVEPGPRLRELESLVLGHDERLIVERPDNEVASSRSVGRPLGRPTGTVTFGFTDVEDPSRWWTTHRLELAAAMARHHELVGTAVQGHGGYVFTNGGDSFGVAFHRATDAVSWALELQTAIAGQPRAGSVELRLRIGIHTGEAEEREQGYFGPAVNVAARLAAAGHGGQTLLSGATSSVLDRIDLRDLGTYRLDGVVTEQRVLQLGDDEHPPLRTEHSRRGNLPRRLGRLIGRDNDLEVIDRALAGTPAVTLVGPGGIGKTRLALAAARRAVVDDGAWLIDLTEITSPADVPRIVAGALGIKESPGRNLGRSVVAFLRQRQALVVLDNCEHVIEGVAPLAQAIAEECPNVKVLATSRERLGLGHGHERVIAVAPLEPAGPGVELFNERASAVCPGFDPEAGRRDIEMICRRLDGVPLAIELAAARTTSLATAELLERLDDQLRLLVGGRRTSAQRHRTLRATVQWSFDLLSPPEQVLFQQLSIFTGPFDRAAAETIGADPAAGMDDGSVKDEADAEPAGNADVLGGLVDRSMLIAESGPFGQRFRLLETIRQFAAERLRESGQAGLIAGRHARWCLDRVTQIHRLLAGPAEVEGVARLDEIWPNLRAAFEWACTTGDLRLGYALIRPVVAEIPFRSRNEIGDWAERVLELAPADDEELVVFALTWAAQRYKLVQDPPAYERLVARYGAPDHPLIRHARASVDENYHEMGLWAAPSLLERRRRGDDDLAEQLEVDVGAALLFCGSFEEHDVLMAKLADRYRIQGPPTLLNWSLMLLGYSASFQGRHERAEQLFDEAVSVRLPERTHSPNQTVEARTAFRQGDRLRAYRILGAHIQDLVDTNNMHGACVASVEFINMVTKINRLPEAATILRYLETGNLLDAPVWDAQVAEARSIIAGAAGTTGGAVGTLEVATSEIRLDDRQALEYMGRVLRRLAHGDLPGEAT